MLPGSRPVPGGKKPPIRASALQLRCYPGGLRAEPAEFIKASRPESFVPERTEDGRPARVLGTERHWRSLTQPHSLSWANWPYWSSVGMVCKGYSDDDIRKIIGENFLRVAGPIPNERPRGRLI